MRRQIVRRTHALTDVVFSPHAYRMQPIGGVSRYVTELIGAMRSLGVNAHALTYLHANTLARAARQGVDVGSFGPHKARQAITLAVDTALERVSPTRRRSDVYHYSYYPRAAGGRGRGITAVTVYDMIHERYPEDFDKADHTARLKRRVCRSVDVIFAISEATKSDIIDILGIPAEQITVTPLGPSSLPTLPRNEADTPLLVYVGDRRRAYKNFAAVLRGFAAAEVPVDAELVCAGGGPLTAVESHQIQSLGLAQRVRTVEVSDEELAALYARAFALVVPSKCEGFGLPLVEAMNAGCPIVCSGTGALSEVVGGAALTFDPDSTEELAAALTAATGDDQLRENLSARGRERVLTFSWRQCALRTLDGYRAAGAQ